MGRVAAKKGSSATKKTSQKTPQKRKPLNKKQKALIKNLVSGEFPTQAAAGEAAGYSHRAATSRALTSVNVQSIMNEVMEELGLSDKFLLEKLAEGLEANRVISAIITHKDANESTNDFIEVADHGIRHKFLDTALKLKDRYPATKNDHNFPGMENFPERLARALDRRSNGDGNN